jgi:hypothetical protein
MSPEEKEKYLQQVNAKSMVNKITTTGMILTFILNNNDNDNKLFFLIHLISL